ncbi:hypothetical protein, partial [Streptomyces cyaneofuscatus]|uniref:hypothetical protein n=1 Tax=Streptomyces cyaneofuscatus TaxID=66883 RepID=UPI002FEE873C
MMPNTNLEFRGEDRRVTMCRGGLAGALDKQGMRAGYLVSKQMEAWFDEDDAHPEMAAPIGALPATHRLRSAPG